MTSQRIPIMSQDAPAATRGKALPRVAAMLLATLELLLALPACDVHEFPDTWEETVEGDTTTVDTGIDIVLRLDYSTELPLYREVEYARTRSAADGYCLRHLINIYTPESDGTYGRTYSSQAVVTSNNVNQLDTCLTLHVEPGEHRFIVWTDYIDYGTQEDKYYDTSNFAEIILTDEYEGSCDYRDAFKGTQTAAVYESYADTVTVEMARPMAKFEFVTTDLDKFTEQMAEYLNQKNGTKSQDEIVQAKDIDLDNYSVAIAYTSFMPYSFNIFTDRPADSKTGMYFYGKISDLGDNEAQLGFDFVFVNGLATSVQTALYVYDNDGLLIASTSVITVPLLRSHLTSVYGEFLTSQAEGGVGINPNYDGDYNIEID